MAGKRAAQSRVLAAEARKKDVRMEIEKSFSEARVQLENMLARRALLAERVINLRKTSLLYRKQYLDLGTRSLVDLLNSEQEYHRAQVDVENNKSDIVRTQLDCAFYQGKLREYFNIPLDK